MNETRFLSVLFVSPLQTYFILTIFCFNTFSSKKKSFFRFFVVWNTGMFTEKETAMD